MRKSDRTKAQAHFEKFDTWVIEASVPTKGAKLVSNKRIEDKAMTNTENINQNEISNSVEKLSPSSSSNTLLTLKSVEYLFLAAFVGAGIITFVFPGNQVLVIWLAVFLALWIFLFLINRQVLNKYKLIENKLDLANKAELYNYLSASKNSSKNNPITPAREKALQYSQELIEDYKRTRSNSRNIYYSLQLATVVLSGVTPILVLVDKLETSISWFKWLPVILPAIASIGASIVTSFPFQENWISANTTVELLEAEQEKFILGVTQAYRCYDVADENQRHQKAKEAIENFITQVNNIHLKQVQQSDEPQAREEKTEPVQSVESNQGQSERS